jgi:hypothetical protein
MLRQSLDTYEITYKILPGIAQQAAREALIEQMIESMRRIDYIAAIRARPISWSRQDPCSPIFDPIRAAILFAESGKANEAFWLVFLFVHFGKHIRSGYRLIQDVYGGLGKHRWTWQAISSDIFGFRTWLDRNETMLKSHGGRFGNHRKYQSLSAWKAFGTGSTIQSYVSWVIGQEGHERMITKALERSDGDPKRTFNDLYRQMKVVIGFGRTARFDYLTMIGKLGLARIEPPLAYMQEATGPLEGARLLFGRPHLPSSSAEQEVVELGRNLGVGMQVMEDSLCNWQKSPLLFIPFRG